MKTEIINYTVDGKTFKGFVAYDPTIKEKRPGILVAHAWQGQDNFAKEKAKELAGLGYVGFAADVYGDGVSVDSNEKAEELMAPLFKDRASLRKRIVAAYEALRKLPYVDPKRIGAIGFCFGGLTVIELLRSGADLHGVVSFHGLLGFDMGKMKAKAEPNAKKLNGPILILHGHDDPLVSTAHIQGIQKELTDAGVDWQMHIYGHTSHAFTNPQANDKNLGLIYNQKAAKRSWQSMINFFQETLAP